MVARRSFFSLPDSPKLKRMPTSGSRSTREFASKGGKRQPTSGKSAPAQVSKFAPPTVPPVDEKFRQQKARHYQARGYEALLVIAVNVILSGAAILALTRLIPYQTAHKERLDEITAEVQLLEDRVNFLRAKLPQTFDSGKSQDALLRQQGWMKPNQLSIKILQPSETTTPTTISPVLSDPSAVQNTARRF